MGSVGRKLLLSPNAARYWTESPARESQVDEEEQDER